MPALRVFLAQKAVSKRAAMEEQWVVDRCKLREVWLEHPEWSERERQFIKNVPAMATSLARREEAIHLMHVRAITIHLYSSNHRNAPQPVAAMAFANLLNSFNRSCLGYYGFSRASFSRGAA